MIIIGSIFYLGDREQKKSPFIVIRGGAFATFCTFCVWTFTEALVRYILYNFGYWRGHSVENKSVSFATATFQMLKITLIDFYIYEPDQERTKFSHSMCQQKEQVYLCVSTTGYISVSDRKPMHTHLMSSSYILSHLDRHSMPPSVLSFCSWHI